MNLWKLLNPWNDVEITPVLFFAVAQMGHITLL